ncbi:Ig-like domain repeat protein [Conexibacter sp. JD483]|uniref:Ig-like domain repeat protein n=1 Tax=unclassified Conexibacter TaxID=2627773 RepID=UPI002718BB81|nr:MULTISPECIES: Ig-like domain repeat protein [unclassified Conexibacter]MDO8184760.1 Ig-like domain repeat protein [Conexibacter sp. CPCC 205706]MDO8196535.1 Ig-like domain repeat protein [Conexibacter sp. CPCC 205762]MDR9369021.1 Ig-like domain repeat protein [Conexibacter sp. JD483]
MSAVRRTAAAHAQHAPRGRRRRPHVLAGSVAALAALAVAALPGGAAAAGICPDAPPASQTTQRFGYTGFTQHFAVPAFVDKVRFSVRGAHGGSSAGKTGAGGRPGVVTGVVPVPAGGCLGVTVGGYDGGFGYGSGGGQGKGGPFASDGNRGGGGSAFGPDGGTPLVVAGGGGGAGGNGARWEDQRDGLPGGAGGDGAGGRGAGTPQGGAGSQPPTAQSRTSERDVFGLPQHGSGSNGGDSDRYAPFDCGLNSGGGGGGGGGISGGGAGSRFDPTEDRVDPTWQNPDFPATPDFARSWTRAKGVLRAAVPGCADLTYGFGGGGGAGGDSFADPSAVDPAFTVDQGTCPPNGGQFPACEGAIELDWSIDVGAVTAAGGAVQETTIGSRYPGLLQARVTAANDAPIPGLSVTFTLPASGASGSFDDGSATAPRSVTVTTDAAGVATAPPLVAGTAAGAFSATAAVAGVAQPARYALTNQPAVTATSLSTAPGNPSVTGEQVRFLAQVVQSPSSAPTPAGTVVYEIDGRRVGAAVPLDADGAALSIPVQLSEDATVTARFRSDGQFAGSSGTMTQRVLRAGTAIDVRSSANPSGDDEPVSFTADVAALAPGAGTPTGSVTFVVDGSPLGGPVALTDGSARSSALALPAGTHDVTVTYDGSPHYAPATADAVQSVGATATATELTADPRSPVVGQASLIRVTVKPPSASPAAVPSGGVDVLVDGIVVCDGVTLVAARATCAVTAPSLPGAHQITARYEPGSLDFSPSRGALAQLVGQGRTTVTLEATPDPSVFGEPVQLHAQVAAAGAATGEPTGAVSFTVDGIAIGQPVPLRDGRADSIAIPALAAGPHVLRASYGGDASFLANAAGATQGVDPAATLSTIRSSAPDARLGGAPRFTMQLGIAPPAFGTPGGSVQFAVDGRPYGPPVAIAGATAVSPPVAGLRAGAHLVRASYLGAPGFTRVDAQLTQWIAGPDAAVVPGTGTDARPPVLTPRQVAAAERSPLLCTRSLAIASVAVSGARVRLRGVAATDLAGTRIAIVQAGRTVARPRVNVNGGWSVAVARPRGLEPADVVYVATAGSARSEPVSLAQPLRIVRVRSIGRGKVRVEATLSGGARRSASTAIVERRVGCGLLRQVARPRIAAAARAGGPRRIAVTVARPRTGSAIVRIRVGTALVSLPLVVSS